jgi:hypothetical protein
MRRVELGRRSIVLVAVLLSLSACSNIKPFEPPVASEIPNGPGLLSGNDGEFTIFRK